MEILCFSYLKRECFARRLVRVHVIDKETEEKFSINHYMDASRAYDTLAAAV